MLADSTLVIAATAARDSITHIQAHSGARGAAGTTNAVGSRIAITGGTVDADGDIVWTGPFLFTGLTANGAVPEISYWSASTAGTYRGGGSTTGDATANAAGEYRIDSITENFAST